MSWLTWPFRIMGFTGWFAQEIVVSNLAVMRDNLTPGQDSTTGIAELPTRCRTEFEVTLLASLITLTPGTLSLGASHTDGLRTLYVHGMYSPDPDHLRAELRRIESRMLRAVRREDRTS